MKTPKQWAPEMVERFRLGFNCLEVDLEEVMEVLAKEIQLDAYLAGLRKAQEIAENRKGIQYTKAENAMCNDVFFIIGHEITRAEKEGMK